MKIHKGLIWVFSLLIVAIAVGCSGFTKGDTVTPTEGVGMKYGRLLTMKDYEGFTQVTVSDPWRPGKILATYILVPREDNLPEGLPEGVIVRTPLKKAAVASSVHISLLDELGALGSTGGICDLKYLNIPKVKDLVKQGKIKDCGSSMNPTIESIMDLQPDALLLSPYEESGSFGKLGNLGIPIIKCADYMEPSPLGRAEWIKFYGKLFGKEEKSDAIFAQVETDYNNLKEKAKKGKGLKTLVNKPMSGTWYIPGGKSTTGQVITDAGAIYPWSADDTAGATPLSFETVLDKDGDADIWFFTYNTPSPLTLSGLLNENGKFLQLRAFKQKNVWGCNTSNSTYFEDVPFHPERLLRDIIIMTNPKVIDGETKYYQRLQP